ncbi:MAG: hypothetical protein V4594_21125 [Bacteroidota bacterium]
MKKYILTILCCTVLHSTHAQQGDPGMPGGDPDVPIDGGIAFLLLAGAAYGAKKIKDSRKDKEQP